MDTAARRDLPAGRAAGVCVVLHRLLDDCSLFRLPGFGNRQIWVPILPGYRSQMKHKPLIYMDKYK